MRKTCDFLKECVKDAVRFEVLPANGGVILVILKDGSGNPVVAVETAMEEE
jgi:hypothetical protein